MDAPVGVQTGSEQKVYISLMGLRMVIVYEEEHCVRELFLPYFMCVLYYDFMSVLVFHLLHRPFLTDIISNHHITTCRAMSRCPCTRYLKAWRLPIRSISVGKIFIDVAGGSGSTTEGPACPLAFGEDLPVVIDESGKFFLLCIMGDEINGLFSGTQQ